MEYLIKSMAGETIASFKHKEDRDFCLKAMVDYFGEVAGSLEAVDE